MASKEHTNGGDAESGAGPSSASAASPSGLLSPISPRASSDLPTRGGTPAGSVEAELERTRQEKEHLSHQYRSLLGKLTAMRNTLGEKLKEDAEELDRREVQIQTLTTDNQTLQDQVTQLREELASASSESESLAQQLQQLRSQGESSSSDVLSLTREMRELRGEMERLRAEREEWEAEAERERGAREALEDETRAAEHRELEARKAAEDAVEQLDQERERASNLQEVLGEFQQAKDSELRQATNELESQLKRATAQLSEFKLRAANAESSLSSMANDASRSSTLEKDLRDKNATISKLRHDAVVTNEHLTEALRRLRKNTSDNNVDRRLVTNILLQFLTTARADSKRFEMLSLLSTILSWDEAERERAGLARSSGKGRTPAPARNKGGSAPERTAEEEAAMNESFSNLFVEFLLKEASHGTSPGGGQSPLDSPSASRSPPPVHASPTPSGSATPSSYGYGRSNRAMSSSSSAGIGGGASTPSLDQLVRPGQGHRKPSFGLQEAMGGGR